MKKIIFIIPVFFLISCVAVPSITKKILNPPNPNNPTDRIVEFRTNNNMSVFGQESFEDWSPTNKWYIHLTFLKLKF